MTMVFLVLAFLGWASAAAGAEVEEVRGERLAIGEALPKILWRGLGDADAAYLGLEPGDGGTPGIAGELLLLEFFNAHCQSCMAQAPVMARLQTRLDADRELAGAARLLGVAEGNSAAEVATFAEDYGLTFPLVADPRFAAYTAFGNPGGTPYTVLCVRRGGSWVVATAHLGAITTELLPLFDMKQYRNLDPSLFAGLAAEAQGFRTQRTAPKPRLTEAELVERLRRLPRFEGRAAVKPLDLPHAGRAYQVDAPGGPYFARLYSVAPVCDICHALHFVGVFDRYGEVVDLLKVRISRYGNQEISPEEVAFLRNRLAGFSAFRPRLFDPATDAISGATMSSSLVFNALARSGDLFDDLIEAGLVSP